MSVISHGKRKSGAVNQIRISRRVYQNLCFNLGHSVFRIDHDTRKFILFFYHTHNICVVKNLCAGCQHHILRHFLPALGIKRDQIGFSV